MKYYLLAIIWLLVLITTHSFAQFDRLVLIEEGTGTWCQHCPRGEVYAQELQKQYPGQYVFVAVHNGDPMEVEEYDSSLALAGLPSGMIDRTFVSPLNPFTNLDDDLSRRLSKQAIAKVGVNTAWDAQSRNLVVELTAEFSEDLTGDLRLGVIIVEDGVTGPPPRYSQVNAFAGGADGPMAGYENLPNPVPAGKMVYNHVARAIPGGFNGLQGNLPSTIEAGVSYTHNVVYTVPEEYDEEYIQVVGFILDVDNSEVLNAGKSSYLLGHTNGLPFFHSKNMGLAQVDALYSFDVVCHDPDHEVLSIIADSNQPSWLKIEMQNENEAILTGTPPIAGSYSFVLTVSDGTDIRNQEFTLMVEEGQGSWTQVGEEGFSNQISRYGYFTAVDSDDVLYTLGITNGEKVFVNVYSGTDWAEISTPFSSVTPLYGEISVHPLTNEPWVFVESGIYKYSGSIWEQVGNNLISSSYFNIKFASDGTPYAAGAIGGGGVQIYTFDGVDWISITPPANTFLLSWLRMEMTSKNFPMILVNEFPSQAGYSRVYEYNGTSWDALGDRIYPDKWTSGSSASLHQLAIGDDDLPYVMIGHEDGSNVYAWDGGDWNVIKENIDGGVRESFDIGVGANGNLYAVYQDATGSLTCESYDGENWSFLGSPSFTPNISSVEMIIYSDGFPGVVYSDISKGGSSSFKRFTSTISNIKETSLIHEELQLFPNPTSGKVTLAYGNGEYFQIIDINGRVMMQQDLPQQQTDQGINLLDIDLDMQGGIYFLRVYDGSSIDALKFIKE